MDHGSGETVITLDHTREVEDNVTSTDSKALSRPPPYGFVEAVKMFTTRSRISELTRKPFFAIAKSSRVNIQPWPSATNLKSYPVTGNVWNELRESTADDATITNKFKIPSIDVRQTSLEYDIEEYDDSVKADCTEEDQASRSVSSR